LEAVAFSGLLEGGQRRRGGGLRFGEACFFAPLRRQPGVALGLVELVRRGDEFRIAGAFFGRCAEALQPFDIPP
jgi:hypothetical protein